VNKPLARSFGNLVTAAGFCDAIAGALWSGVQTIGFPSVALLR
jgi:hypothetical protein